MHHTPGCEKLSGRIEVEGFFIFFFLFRKGVMSQFD
jgi:hypothetical protein